jgi:hypothetical protein
MALSLRITYQYERIGKFNFWFIESGELGAKARVAIINFFIYLFSFFSLFTNGATILVNSGLLAGFIYVRRRIKSDPTPESVGEIIPLDLSNETRSASGNSTNDTTKVDNTRSLSETSSDSDTDVYDKSSSESDSTKIYNRDSNVEKTKIYNEEGSPQISFCPNCGASLEDFDKPHVCFDCGTDLPS